MTDQVTGADIAKAMRAAVAQARLEQLAADTEAKSDAADISRKRARSFFARPTSSPNRAPVARSTDDEHNAKGYPYEIPGFVLANDRGLYLPPEGSFSRELDRVSPEIEADMRANQIEREAKAAQALAAADAAERAYQHALATGARKVATAWVQAERARARAERAVDAAKPRPVFRFAGPSDAKHAGQIQAQRGIVKLRRMF